MPNFHIERFWTTIDDSPDPQGFPTEDMRSDIGRIRMCKLLGPTATMLHYYFVINGPSHYELGTLHSIFGVSESVLQRAILRLERFLAIDYLSADGLVVRTQVRIPKYMQERDAS